MRLSSDLTWTEPLSHPTLSILAEIVCSSNDDVISMSAQIYFHFQQKHWNQSDREDDTKKVCCDGRDWRTEIITAVNIIDL